MGLYGCKKIRNFMEILKNITLFRDKLHLGRVIYKKLFFRQKLHNSKIMRFLHVTLSR